MHFYHISDDTRDVQTFQIPEQNIYTKSIRLELLTHYGKEHYCTLSSFRVYGISMVDEYEAEAAAFGVTENAGAPMKITVSETISIDLPVKEPLIISPEVTEPPLETTLEIPPINIIPEPILPLAPWQIRDCLKCDNNHPKAVTAWLCYVFSPSICSKRNIKNWKNGTIILSKGQTTFLKAVLQPRLLCPLFNVSTEKKVEEKPTVLLSSTKHESIIMHTLETEVKKQSIVQHKRMLKNCYAHFLQ
uniref:SUN domain-containing protein n=1 Tax=Panagrolaimus superbus TaxID=310955 RepID=A0A914YTM5_9BILA